MVHDHPVDPTAQRSLGKFSGKTPLVVFLVLALAIGAVGYAVFVHHYEAMRQDKSHELSAVADLKVSQIVGWLDERRGDAAATTRDPILAQEVHRWLQRGAPHDEAARRIELRLQGLREAYSYDKVILLDREGRPALVAGDALHPHAHAESNQRVAEAMTAGQPRLSDLHVEAETDGATAQVNIDLYAPLLGADGHAVAAIYFQIDPYRFLFPFIQSWPTPSRSAETLLIRRDGDDVLYLNELRHRKDSALKFRLPLNTPDLPAAKSLRGETGVIEGVDYRGVPVLAALRTVAGTSWHLVAKIAQAEVFASARKLAIGVGAMVAVLIAGAGLLVALWSRRQHAQFLAMHFKDELERQALVQHFDYLSRFANDIILLVDEEHRIVEANDTAVKAYGYPRERLLQLRSSDLRASEALSSFEADQAQIASHGSLVYQTVQQRSDGSTFPVECSVRVITVEGKQYRQAIIRDISERMQADEALRDSEERFRGISHAAQDAIILLDPAGNVRYWNPAAERTFGYAASEVQGKNVHRLLAPQRYREEAQRGFAQFSKTGDGRFVGRTVELTALRKDGTEFPVMVSFSGFDRAGAWYAIGIARDITERKRTEEALRDSEWRFQQLAENIGEAFWFLSFRPEQLVFVNPAFTRIWGIAEQDIRYRPRILMETVHPDDREQFVRTFESWRARNSAEGYELQYRIVRPDGSTRWVCNHVAGVKDDHGGLWGACGVVEDITARVQAEEALRRQALIIDQTRDAVISTDLEGRVTSWNKGAERLYGYSSGEVLDRHISFVAPEEDRDVFQSQVIAPLMEKGAHEFEARRRRKSGEDIHVHNSLSVLKDAQGRATSLVGFVVDITERKHAEEALREYAGKLRRLSHRLFETEEIERRRLARELHDSIGQNLTVLNMTVGMIRAGLPADAREQVSAHLGDCEALLQTTGDLVRDVMADLRPPGLDELGLLAALTGYARQTGNRGRVPIAVSGAEITPRLPPVAEIALFRIAQEAIVNALKHAHATNVALTLESRPDAAIMVIADNGFGFDPAVQRSQATAHLGLVNMRERAQSIGGQLRVESAPGRGTRVIVEAPRVAPALSDQPHLPGLESA